MSPTLYIKKAGVVVGALLFFAVVATSVVPFGLIGVSGRFLGDRLFPYIVARIQGSHVSFRKVRGAVLLSYTEAEEPKDIKVARISARATLFAAVIAALASVLIALFK